MRTGGTTTNGTRFLGRHPRVLHLLDRARRLGRGDQPVLLHGETGTGKELLARLLHEASPRAAGPFVALNCAAVPGSLLESEMFGAAAGSYTGASSARGGLVEAAHGGTLFLDEVGDMPPAMQAGLLRVLEDGRTRRIGECRERPVDFRIVAATHRDLDTLAAAGSFRADLRWRLGTVLRLPPLRERRTDLPILVRAFLDELVGGGEPPRLAIGAVDALECWPFPGNVRELRARLATAVAVCETDVLTARDLGLDGTTGDAAPADRRWSRVLGAARGRGWVSTATVARVSGLPRRTVQRALAALRADGRVERSGRGPATRYRVVDGDGRR